MHDRYMDNNEDSILSEYTKPIKKRRRRAIDSEVERMTDMIYDDLQDMILEWKTDHAVKRHGATQVDYDYHRIGTMKYAETLTDAIAEELAERVINEKELNDITYLEE